jgi:hypothetical protein
VSSPSPEVAFSRCQVKEGINISSPENIALKSHSRTGEECG